MKKRKFSGYEILLSNTKRNEQNEVWVQRETSTQKKFFFFYLI